MKRVLFLAIPLGYDRMLILLSYTKEDSLVMVTYKSSISAKVKSILCSAATNVSTSNTKGIGLTKTSTTKSSHTVCRKRQIDMLSFYQSLSIILQPTCISHTRVNIDMGITLD